MVNNFDDEMKVANLHSIQSFVRDISLLASLLVCGNDENKK